MITSIEIRVIYSSNNFRNRIQIQKGKLPYIVSSTASYRREILQDTINIFTFIKTSVSKRLYTT